MITLIQTRNSINFSPNQTDNFLKQRKNDKFSVLHLNIRSLEKNIDSLGIILLQLNFSFKATYLTGTWCEQENQWMYSLFNLPDYRCMYQLQKDRKDGSVCIYTESSLVFTEKEDLSVTCDVLESLAIELTMVRSRM